MFHGWHIYCGETLRLFPFQLDSSMPGWPGVSCTAAYVVFSSSVSARGPPDCSYDSVFGLSPANAAARCPTVWASRSSAQPTTAIAPWASSHIVCHLSALVASAPDKPAVVPQPHPCATAPAALPCLTIFDDPKYNALPLVWSHLGIKRNDA